MPSTNPRNYDATPSRKVAFLGLGVMGYPMAGHLAMAGHQVTAYNRTAAKAHAWAEEFPSGHQAATPRDAVKGARMAFCCVGNDDDLRSVVSGDQQPPGPDEILVSRMRGDLTGRVTLKGASGTVELTVRKARPAGASVAGGPVAGQDAEPAGRALRVLALSPVMMIAPESTVSGAMPAS